MTRILSKTSRGGMTGGAFLASRSSFEDMVAALPALDTWLDPAPRFAPLLNPAVRDWYARKGVARFTSNQSTTLASIGLTTQFNGKPTMTFDGNGIWYPYKGRMLDFPSSSPWTVCGVVSLDDTATRTLFGMISPVVTEANPLGLFLGFNGGRVRRWSNDAAKQAYSLPTMVVGTPAIFMASWHPTKGTRMAINTINGSAATISPPGPDFGPLGITSVMIGKSESQTSANRFKGSYGAVFQFGADYFEPEYDWARALLITSMSNEYGVALV